MDKILGRVASLEKEIMLRNISEKRKLVEITEIYTKGLSDLKSYFGSEVASGKHELAELEAQVKQMSIQIEEAEKPIRKAQKKIEEKEAKLKSYENEIQKQKRILDEQKESVRMSGLAVGQIRDTIRLNLNDISLREKIAHKKMKEADEALALLDERTKAFNKEVALFNKERTEFTKWRENELIEIESIRRAYQEANVVK
jgi:chromosome segregation ATPase